MTVNSQNNNMRYFGNLSFCIFLTNSNRTMTRFLHAKCILAGGDEGKSQGGELFVVKSKPLTLHWRTKTTINTKQYSRILARIKTYLFTRTRLHICKHTVALTFYLLVRRFLLELGNTVKRLDWSGPLGRTPATGSGGGHSDGKRNEWTVPRWLIGFCVQFMQFRGAIVVPSH